jgi:hypothetical protein
MAISPLTTFFLVAAALIAALSLGPSFAHVLEAPPRLSTWTPELWRETTVFNGQFRLFAGVGAPLDIAAILLPAALAIAFRGERAALYFAIAAICYAVALGLWFAVVAPANAQLATWTPGPIPENFSAVRDRWEYGHMAVTAAKLPGLVAIAMALLSIPSVPSLGNA